MNKLIKSLFITIITLSINNCYIVEPNKDEIIMPLAIGNYWIYDIISYDDSITENTIMISINKDTTINNVKWFKDSWQILFTNKNNGLWDRAISLSTLTALFLKYPGRPGDQWKRHVNEAGYYEMGQIISTNSHIEIYGHTYIAYEYEFRYQDRLRRKYYAVPSIGIVKIKEYQSSTEEMPTLRAEYILSDHNIN